MSTWFWKTKSSVIIYKKKMEFGGPVSGLVTGKLCGHPWFLWGHKDKWTTVLSKSWSRAVFCNKLFPRTQKDRVGDFGEQKVRGLTFTVFWNHHGSGKVQHCRQSLLLLNTIMRLCWKNSVWKWGNGDAQICATVSPHVKLLAQIWPCAQIQLEAVFPGAAGSRSTSESFVKSMAAE